MTDITTPELAQIAERIRARRAWAVIETGRDLFEAKKLIGHGDFQHWLWSQAGLELRTAQKCMQVARWADGLPEAKSEKLTLLPKAALYELARKSTTEPARAAVFEALEAGERMNIKNVEYYIRRGDRLENKTDVRATAVKEPIDDPERGGTVEVLPPEPAPPKLSSKPSKKSKKPTKAQLEKRKERLAQSIEFFLQSRIESIDLSFFSPTGDQLHPDNFYPAVDTYLDAATAARLIAELTETRATIAGWIGQLKAEVAGVGRLTPGDAGQGEDSPQTAALPWRKEGGA